MATQIYLRPLTTNEQAGNAGFTHEVVFAAGTNLTETTTNTAQTYNLFKTHAGDTIVKWALIADPAFKDASDAAFNSTAFSFGDEDSATRFLNAVQLNENGTEVLYTYGNTAYTYTAVKQITCTIASMSAKALSDIDTGRAILLVELCRLETLTKALQP